MKVPKEVKERLEELPDLFFALAKEAIVLAAKLTASGEDIGKVAAELETED